MTISIGDKIPSVTLHVMKDDGPEAITTDEIFGGKKVAIFGLPGAFTPTCSAKHVPGFFTKADALAKKGVDRIVCISVNDAFVMGAWGKDQGVGDTIMMVADGSADFTRATGLELDLTGRGFGLRCQRFSMVVNDGTVENFNQESDGGYEVTSAEHMLANL